MSESTTNTPYVAPIQKDGTPSIPPNFPPVDPLSIRAILMLSAANYMMTDNEWPYRETTIQLKSQGDELGVYRLFGANHPSSIRQVFERSLDISIMNPSLILAMAHRGVGLFAEPMQVALIAVLPHEDQLGFAVSRSSGLTSLDDIRERHYPVRLCVRGSMDQSTADLVEEVLKVHGFNYSDIESWGGKVSHDQQMPPMGFPNLPSRIERAVNGEYDAIFEEGVPIWANAVEGAGLRLLDISPKRLVELERIGFKSATIEKARYETLPADNATVDFSGWPIYTRIDTPDLLVWKFCEALEARKTSIPWYIGPVTQESLPLERIVTDSPGTPLMGVPFHPAAEAFWNSAGYLK